MDVLRRGIGTLYEIIGKYKKKRKKEGRKIKGQRNEVERGKKERTREVEEYIHGGCNMRRKSD
jgi:hypothetical protein